MRRAISFVGAAAVLGVGVAAAPAHPGCPHYSARQARAAVRRAEQDGSTGALVRANARCYRARARASGTAAPDALAEAIVDAAPSNPVLLKQVARGLTTRAGTYSPALDGPIVPDPGSAVSANLRAHVAGQVCQPNALLTSTDRVYSSGGAHMMSITKTLQGWCYDGTVVISTTSWGHAWWAHVAYCVAQQLTAHGADGSWIGSHSTWAHGGAWGNLGSQGTFWCVPFTGQYPATLRVAGSGYWDAYDDYPRPYSG